MTSLRADLREELARDAVTALRDVCLRKPPSELHDLTLADGYAIGARADELLCQDGSRHSGRKLGFTDRSSWRRLSIDRPVWAFMYDHSVRASDAGELTLPTDRAIAPRAEVEIVFGIRRAPDSEDLVSAIDWVALGIEVIDCHYPDWRFTAPDALADLLFHSSLLVGPKRTFHDPADVMEWATSLPSRTSLSEGSDVAVRGSTSAALGGPLESFAELTAILSQQGAAPLQAGEVIATGTTTTPFALVVGQRITARIEGVQLLSLSVDVRSHAIGG